MIAIDLSGKTALVTGAGQGLGYATACRLHEAGANVVVNYFEDDAGNHRRRAEQVVAELGERSVALAADVREPDQITSMLDGVQTHFGGIDIVVNNAAVLRDKSLKNMTDSDWNDVIDTNLSGVFHVCKAVSTRLNPNGRIVNLASISGVVGFFGQANYSAAKAGVIGLTKVLSKELAKNGTTVNSVAPGVALTEMGKSIPAEIREEMFKQIPLRRFAEPEEIANAILFLCSPLADYITGQVLHVNGGWWG